MTDLNQKTFSFKFFFIFLFVFSAFFLFYDKIFLKKNSFVEQENHFDSSLTVNAQKPVAQSLSVQKTYDGYVTALHQVDILPFINGFIDAVYVKGGQFVKKNDILVVLQQQEYKAQIDAAIASVDRANADFQNAKTYYERIQKAGKNAVSETTFDTAKAQYLSTLAVLSQAEADLAKAKIMYDYTVIKAPIDGIVGNVSLTKGDYVSASSSPLFSIIQSSPIRVVFSLGDKEYLEIQKGKRRLSDVTLRLKLADGEMYPATGRLTFMDNSLNRQTNSLAVYADFDNAERYLITNAYVTVIMEQTHADSVRLAQQAVFFTNEGAFVHVANNGSVRKEKIELLGTTDNVFIVPNVFEKGDFILLNAPEKIPEHAKLKLNIVSVD